MADDIQQVSADFERLARSAFVSRSPINAIKLACFCNKYKKLIEDNKEAFASLFDKIKKEV